VRLENWSEKQLFRFTLEWWRGHSRFVHVEDLSRSDAARQGTYDSPEIKVDVAANNSVSSRFLSWARNEVDLMRMTAFQVSP
jgi:hypothetical protein